MAEDWIILLFRLYVLGLPFLHQKTETPWPYPSITKYTTHIAAVLGYLRLHDNEKEGVNADTARGTLSGNIAGSLGCIYTDIDSVFAHKIWNGAQNTQENATIIKQR